MSEIVNKYQEDKIIHSKSELLKNQNTLIEKSKDKLFRNELPKGAVLKKKTLTTRLVINLIYVYKYYKYTGSELTDYFKKNDLLIHLKKYKKTTRFFHHLKYWDCICQMPTSPKEVIYKKGYYGITENGIKFVQREIALPKFAYVYNDFAYSHKPVPVMITDLVPESDLEELLKP